MATYALYCVKQTDSCSFPYVVGKYYVIMGNGWTIEKPLVGCDINAAHNKLQVWKCGCQIEVVEL